MYREIVNKNQGVQISNDEDCMENEGEWSILSKIGELDF